MSIVLVEMRVRLCYLFIFVTMMLTIFSGRLKNHNENKMELDVNLIDSPSFKAYPIPTLSYLIINVSTSPEHTCEQMKHFVKLVKWCLNSPTAKQIATQFDMIPISTKLFKLEELHILDQITCNREKIIDLIAADEKALTTVQILIIAGTVLVSESSIFLITLKYLHSFQCKTQAKKTSMCENKHTYIYTTI